MAFALATFNVKDLLVPRSEAEKAVFPAKVAALVETVLATGAEVVGLQEVGGADALAPVLSALGSSWTSVVGTQDERGIGNALVSRVPLLHSTVHTAESLPFPTFRQGAPAPFGRSIPLRRGFVHVALDGGPALGPVDIFVAHFKSRLGVPLVDGEGRPIPPSTPWERAEGRARALVWRSAEALFLRRLVDEVLTQRPGGAVAVLGDFNDSLESTPLRLLVGDGPGRLTPAAHRVPAASRFSVLHGTGPQCIDHVLLTASLVARLQDARYLNAALRDHGPFRPGAPPTVDSDHAAHVARFA